jgi:hypothetical protein
MINIIKTFEDCYNDRISLSINSQYRDMGIFAHKDRVGFFVVKKDFGKHVGYILYRYGNIDDAYIITLNKLYSKLVWEINIVVTKIDHKYIFVNVDKELDLNDFLMYVPKYFIENWFLFWPYLDNIISYYALTQLDDLPTIYRSFDEESKLLYSSFPSLDTAIVLDTIWQDYLDDEIDLEVVYNITSTAFSKDLKELKLSKIKNIQLSLSFQLEIDKIKANNKYHLLCPIQRGHQHDSSVRIDTLNSFVETINLLFLWLIWKKF